MAIDIGVQFSSNPARLIQQSGQFLSENIKSIGQQVQGTILELNTRKDLGRMVQNLQGLNVQSNEFPQQAIQMATQHPLAIQDPRGQLALSVLSKEHGRWKQEQLALSRISPMGNAPGIGIYNKTTGDVVTPLPQKGVPVYGRGLTNPVTGEVIAPEGTREKPEGPYTLAPGAQRRGPDGAIIAENPKAAPEITPYQDAQLKNAGMTQKRQNIQAQIRVLENEIDSGEKKYRELEKLEKEAETKKSKASGPILGLIGKDDRVPAEETRSRYNTEKTITGSIVDDRKKKRQLLLEELGALGAEEVATDDLGLPPVTPQAAQPVQPQTRIVERNGKKYEVDDATRKVLREVP